MAKLPNSGKHPIAAHSYFPINLLRYWHAVSADRRRTCKHKGKEMFEHKITALLGLVGIAVSVSLFVMHL